jgi:hypothetical protein
MANSQERLVDDILASTPEDNELKARTIDELIKMGVEIRDELREEGQKFKKYEASAKDMLLRIGMALKLKGDELGVDSFKTSEGTAYRNVKESYRVGEWDKVLKFIQDNQYWQMLEKRVGKLATKEIHSTSGAIPPGVEYIVEEVFVIRRPNEKARNDD